MNCEELKNKILNNTLDDSFLVFVYPDNKFVVDQYVDEIATRKGLTKTYIDSLQDIAVSANEFFEVAKDKLYVLYSDKMTLAGDLTEYTNTIVVCKELTNIKEYSQYVVKFDKLTEDQIKEYMEVLCPGLGQSNIDWLYNTASGDIYRIYFELMKIKGFSESSQANVFNTIKSEGGYRDLNSLTIFNFINAFLKKDSNLIRICLENLDVIDIEGTGVVTLLIRNLKNIIDIQTNPRATPESLQMSEKQFRAIKANCGKYNLIQLVNMFEFLTGIDYRLKSGQLEIPENSQLVGYLMTHLMRNW